MQIKKTGKKINIAGMPMDEVEITREIKVKTSLAHLNIELDRYKAMKALLLAGADYCDKNGIPETQVKIVNTQNVLVEVEAIDAQIASHEQIVKDIKALK